MATAHIANKIDLAALGFPAAMSGNEASGYDIVAAVSSGTLSAAVTAAQAVLSLQIDINIAVTEGVPLLLPPGTTTVTFTAGVPRLVVSDDLHIIGAGSGRSRIQFGPETPSFLYSGFEVAAGKKLTIEGVRLSGPADPGAMLDGNGNPTGQATYGISHLGGTGGAVTLRDVKMDGWFQTGLNVADADADTQIRLDDCDIQAWAVGVNGNANPNAEIGKRIVAYRTKFRGKGAAFASILCHLIYPNPGTSLLLEDCEFYDSPGDGYCLHHFSASANVGARFGCIIVNPYVAPSCKRGFLLSNVGLTHVRGGVIRAADTGVKPRGPAVFDGVEFRGVTTGVGVYGSVAPGIVYEFLGCNWSGGSTAIDAAHAGTIWRVLGGSIYGMELDNNHDAAVLDVIGTYLDGVNFRVDHGGTINLRNCTKSAAQVVPSDPAIIETGSIVA